MMIRILKNNRAVLDRLVLPPDEGELNAAECFVHNYLVHMLVVLLHVRFSVVGPIPFLLAAIFFPGHPYIGSILPYFPITFQHYVCDVFKG